MGCKLPTDLFMGIKSSYYLLLNKGSTLSFKTTAQLSNQKMNSTRSTLPSSKTALIMIIDEKEKEGVVSDAKGNSGQYRPSIFYILL